MSDKKEKWKKIVEEAEKNNAKKEEIAESPVKEDKTDPTPKRGYVANAKYVNVRNRPVMNAPVLKIVKENDEFEVLEVLPNYIHINLDHFESAYIDARYFVLK